MIKNNFKALLVHLFVGIISFVAFIITHSSTPKWASEAAAKRHALILTAIALAIIIVSLILYYIAGRLFFTCQGNNIRNILSVSIIAVGGSIWWIATYLICASKSGLLNYVEWFYYSLFNTYSLSLIIDMNIDNAFILLIFPLLPSIALSIGLIEKQIIKRKPSASKNILEEINT